MQKEKEEMSIGVLDIYGFEIFEVSMLSVKSGLRLNPFLPRLN